MPYNLQERAHLVPPVVAAILNESRTRRLEHDELYLVFTMGWRHPALPISQGFPQADAAGIYFYNGAYYRHDGMEWDEVDPLTRRHTVSRYMRTAMVVPRVGCSEAMHGLFHRRTHHIHNLANHGNDEPTIVHYYWVDNNGNVVNNGGGGVGGGGGGGGGDGGGEGDGGDVGDGLGEGGGGVGTEWLQLGVFVIILLILFCMFFFLL